jgi:ESS family glutamate:Na+ symporter
MLVLALLLLAGLILRVRIRLFQDLFIPAPVLGGVLGLILGPDCLASLLSGEWIRIYSEEWIPVYRVLPGVLITPVMAASILGMQVPGKKEFAESIGKQLGFTIAFYGSQFMLGGIVAALFAERVYPTFGLELFAGFSGGHGTAGVYAQTLRDMGADYWTVGQGVALTTATVGLIFGVLGGITLINFCSRRGQTSLISSPKDVPRHLKTGFIRTVSTRKDLGKAVTSPEVLEPISYTLALIAIPSLLGVLTRRGLAFLEIPGLDSVGEFAWALVYAALLWILLDRLELDYLLDVTIKNRIAGTMVDFLVVAAILSVPLRAVLQHLIPIVVLLAVGVASSVAMFYIGKMVLPDHWVERSIMTFGQCTGVTATGLLLLRIVDPDFKTPAVSAWGVSYAVAFPLSLIYLGLGATLIVGLGPWLFAGLSFIIFVFGFGLAKIFPHPVQRETE